MPCSVDSPFLMSLAIEDGKMDEAKMFMSRLLVPLPFNPLRRLKVRHGSSRWTIGEISSGPVWISGRMETGKW